METGHAGTKKSTGWRNQKALDGGAKKALDGGTKEALDGGTKKALDGETKKVLDGGKMSFNHHMHCNTFSVTYKEISPKCTSVGICGEAEQCIT